LLILRVFGIGKQTQWSQDVVTIRIRAVSVNTGKVLTSVTVQKTIISSADAITALRFFDLGTRAFEGEAGFTINEPGTYAVKSAIEAGVVELIKDGERKGLWNYKGEKNELVQKTTESKRAPENSAAPIQSNNGKDANGSKESGSKQAGEQQITPQGQFQKN
jgi:curli biogenesis system outer membrane secretion channel CsgG